MRENLAGRLGELIMPALRWNADAGAYECEGSTLDEALAMSVGGFCLFGGTADAARSLIRELTERSTLPLLFAADLERGAGQQFEGLTGLPPLAALASLNDAAVMRRAARLTAHEARAVGVNWIFAPVVDLDVEPRNPIVGTRAIGADPDRVARLAMAWIDGCQCEHVLACVKHFPGHGRTTADSHSTLPVVNLPRDIFMATDLVPFRAAMDAGVASIMTAHVAYPDLDPEGVPATLSRPIVLHLLRHELGYGGLVVSDALIMEGVSLREGEIGAAVRAVNAGCDLLLYPPNSAEVLRALTEAYGAGHVSAEHVRQSLERRTAWTTWTAAVPDAKGISLDAERAWAAELCRSVVHVVRGTAPSLAAGVELVVVDDDVGGPYPPASREPLRAALAEHGLLGAAGSEATVLVALFGDIRAWKDRPGYSDRARGEVRTQVQRAAASGRPAVVLQCSHPRLAGEIEAEHVVCAWGGDAAMQRAAAAWVASPRA